jgi:hypothetical protein
VAHPITREQPRPSANDGWVNGTRGKKNPECEQLEKASHGRRRCSFNKVHPEEIALISLGLGKRQILHACLVVLSSVFLLLSRSDSHK